MSRRVSRFAAGLAAAIVTAPLSTHAQVSTGAPPATSTIWPERGRTGQGCGTRWIGDNPPVGLNWTGACKDGMLSGSGTLTWTDICSNYKPCGVKTLNATFIDGVPNGSATYNQTPFPHQGVFPSTSSRNYTMGCMRDINRPDRFANGCVPHRAPVQTAQTPGKIAPSPKPTNSPSISPPSAPPRTASAKPPAGAPPAKSRPTPERQPPTQPRAADHKAEDETGRVYFEYKGPVSAGCVTYQAQEEFDGKWQWYRYANTCGATLNVCNNISGRQWECRRVPAGHQSRSWGEIQLVRQNGSRFFVCPDKTQDGKDVHFDSARLSCYYYGIVASKK